MAGPALASREEGSLDSWLARGLSTPASLVSPVRPHKDVEAKKKRLNEQDSTRRRVRRAPTRSRGAPCRCGACPSLEKGQAAQRGPARGVAVGEGGELAPDSLSLSARCCGPCGPVLGAAGGGHTKGRLLQAACSPCPPGHYCSSPGLASPSGLCSPGFFCLSGALVPNGSLGDLTGGPCPAGTPGAGLGRWGRASSKAACHPDRRQGP